MRKHFDDQIAQLGEQMMAMGALVENTIERAIRALQTDDMAEAAAIRDGDHIVDEKEREVEAMCIHMLLQQQPAHHQRGAENDYRHGAHRRSGERHL